MGGDSGAAGRARRRVRDLWRTQQFDRRKFFDQVRDEFNTTHEPRHLLYLLARIVKGSVRYSTNGRFNQSPDNRRSGMRPTMMRDNLLGVAALLGGRTKTTATDFRRVVSEAGPEDLVYLDPPYQGHVVHAGSPVLQRSVVRRVRRRPHRDERGAGFVHRQLRRANRRQAPRPGPSRTSLAETSSCSGREVDPIHPPGPGPRDRRVTLSLASSRLAPGWPRIRRLRPRRPGRSATRFPVTRTELPPDFLEALEAVQQRRPRVIIDHLLEHGQITTEEIREL